MMTLDSCDSWLKDGGPAALVLRQPLMPVEGEDAVFFPPTYAAPKEKDPHFSGGYNIDTLRDGSKICLIDSVGSQANRMEPLFLQDGYTGLVPQITVKAGKVEVNLLDAGHRAGDAIVRYSSLQETLQNAFKELLAGNALPLAKLAPTSLVFGVWDSRDTQAKAPRLLASTIRAYDVSPIHRSAQYNPATRYEKEGLTEPSENATTGKADKATSDAYAAIGLVDQPATWTHGGILAKSVRREATLHLAALRLLRTVKPEKPEDTLRLRRYLLGLALTALTGPVNGYLRQGCNLVPTGSGTSLTLVHYDGRREEIAMNHAEILAWTQAVAAEFGVGLSQSVPFEKAKLQDGIKKSKKPPKETT